MERSSIIFAISSHFYDDLHNRGRHRRAAGTPAAAAAAAAATHCGEAQKRSAPQTYTWIVEQELAALSKETSETRRWAFEQQAYFGLLPKGARARRGRSRTTTGGLRPGGVGPAGRDLDDDDDDDEEEAGAARLRERLRAAELHAERSQLQEEFDKMEARWRERIAREERRRWLERQWAEEQQRTRAEKEKQLPGSRREGEAWKAYERRWMAVASDRRQLKFKSIPWPTTVPPRNVAEITPDAIAKFVLSPAHSEGMSRKERIKGALRRWHPDRFGRVLSRVDEKDRREVERGVGIVARCLNDLLAREN